MNGIDKVLIFASSNTDTVSDINQISGKTTVGGGEALDFFSKFTNETEWTYMDGELIKHFQNLGLYKLLIVALILTICIILMLKLLGIRTITQDAGVRAEIDNVKTLRKTEKSIIARQKSLNRLKGIVAALGLNPGQVYADYMNYNLKRAGIMAPAGDRALDAFEFNALVKAGIACTTVVCLFVMLFFNLTLGFLLLLLALVMWNTIPNMYVRSLAMEKDTIINNNFFDFYQEIHYILINGGNASISKRIRSYQKGVRNNPEMVRFADTCADYIDIYGEAEGSTYIAKEYREIPDVTKLMRLIKQFNDGGDIKQDLIGFRDKLLLEKQMRMEDEQKKLVTKARLSFNILMIVLVQAILSAMAIYLPDLTNVGSFL